MLKKSNHNLKTTAPTKFMFLIMLVGVFFAAGVADAIAQEIKDGDTVNFENQYKQAQHRYLDSRYWVKNVPQFKGISESVFVMTSDKTNRDNGSGGWIIRKVDAYKANYKQGDGSAIKYGDTVYLINRYPNAGFLDVWDSQIEFYGGKTNTGNDAENLAVFTSVKRDRNKSSSQWKIVPTNPSLNGKPVLATHQIKLESVNHPEFYLETHGPAKGFEFFNSADSGTLLVWITKKGAHANSDKWKIMPSPDFK